MGPTQGPYYNFAWVSHTFGGLTPPDPPYFAHCKILRLGWIGLGRVQNQKYLINIQFTRKKPIIRRL